MLLANYVVVFGRIRATFENLRNTSVIFGNLPESSDFFILAIGILSSLRVTLGAAVLAVK